MGSPQSSGWRRHGAHRQEDPLSSHSYRGFGIRSFVTDPDSPLFHAWTDRDRAPALMTMLGKIPVDSVRGITHDGTVREGLFPIASTGNSTADLLHAATSLIDALDEHQRRDALADIDSPQWLAWFNAVEMPYGARLRTMSGEQRAAVLALIRASHSAEGYAQVWGAMQLNGVLGDMVGEPRILNTWDYAISIFGVPAPDRPWGYQLQGHHLCVTVFVLGDQIVMTPQFIGGEPVLVEDGPHTGLAILQQEELAGYALLDSLDADRRRRAVIHDSMLASDLPPGRHVPADERMLAGSTQDNAVIPYEGLRASEMTTPQKDRLLELLDVYVSRMPQGHSGVRMREVERHLDETRFAWIGGTTMADAAYYKVHSPVILVEFDQHEGVVLDNDRPERFHTHTLVRTPNGNDYGKDLLRQHYETAAHHQPHADHHHHHSAHEGGGR